MGKITASSDFQQVKDNQVSRFVDIFCQDVVQQVNGNLTFSDNMSVVFVPVAFNSASTDVVIAHGLGRVPMGYIPVTRDQPFVVFSGTVASNATSITLQASAPGSTLIMFF